MAAEAAKNPVYADSTWTTDENEPLWDRADAWLRNKRDQAPMFVPAIDADVLVTGAAWDKAKSKDAYIQALVPYLPQLLTNAKLVMYEKAKRPKSFDNVAHLVSRFVGPDGPRDVWMIIRRKKINGRWSNWFYNHEYTEVEPAFGHAAGSPHTTGVGSRPQAPLHSTSSLPGGTETNGPSIPPWVLSSAEVEARRPLIRGGQQISNVLRGAMDVSAFMNGATGIWRRILSGPDLAQLESHYGGSGGKWRAESQAKLAENLTDYLLHGKVPNSQLKPAFDQFRDWLDEVYEDLQGSATHGLIHRDVRSFLDQTARRKE